MTVDSNIGNITKCQKESDRRLRQLGETWEINSELVKNVKNETEKLGVCKTHFNLDQTFYKSSGFKTTKTIKQSIITIRRCLYCNLDFHILTRGKLCYSHIWNLIGKNIIIPCISQFSCLALHKNRESSIFKQVSEEKTSKYLRYILIKMVDIFIFLLGKEKDIYLV